MSAAVYQLDIGPSEKHGIVTKTVDDQTTEVGTVRGENRAALLRHARQLARDDRDGNQRLVTLDLDIEDIAVPITLKLDGRVLMERVTHFALKRAARGPASLVGGSLVDGR